MKSGHKKPSCVITCNAYSYALLLAGDDYALFNSHMCDHTGRPSLDGYGRAALYSTTSSLTAAYHIAATVLPISGRLWSTVSQWVFIEFDEVHDRNDFGDLGPLSYNNTPSPPFRRDALRNCFEQLCCCCVVFCTWRFMSPKKSLTKDILKEIARLVHVPSL